MPRIDLEPNSREPYRMRRPEGLDVQKGSVLSKVPLLHLHFREIVLPNVEKFLEYYHNGKHETSRPMHKEVSKPNVFRFVASLPSHMKISWNLMSAYLT